MLSKKVLNEFTEVQNIFVLRKLKKDKFFYIKGQYKHYLYICMHWSESNVSKKSKSCGITLISSNGHS